MKIGQIKDEFEFDGEFRIPHLTFTSKCPVCGTECDEPGLSIDYPTINGENSIPFYCNECDDYFTDKIIIKIEVIPCNTKS